MKLKFLLLSIITLSLCLTACNKNDVEEDMNSNINNNDYAVNEVKPQPNDDVGYIEDQKQEATINDEEFETEVVDETYEFFNPEYTYNVKEDRNVDRVTDIHEISIDGKMISLPCTYEELKEIFILYTVFPTKYGNILEELKDENQLYSSLELQAIPTTGEGTIKFILTTEDKTAKPIKNMICKEVILSCESYDNEEIMTIALPNGIRFGKEFKDLKDIYKIFDKTNINSTGESWSATTLHDEMDYIIQFFGSNRGLRYIDLSFD